MRTRTLIAVFALALTGMSTDTPPPARLVRTVSMGTELIEYTPRYPLWSDGMDKRRWLSLPAGSAIDKSNPDAWEFPRGTRAWKEFSHGERRVETRFIERLADGSWRYATYVWNEAGTEATLAPEGGIPERGIPSRADCVACHEGAAAPLLGYSAVQLEGTAAVPALGYLHGNCGHCHNDSALPAVGLSFAQSASHPIESAERTRRSLAGRTHLVGARMQHPNPLMRMPPIGVKVADARGMALIETWINHDLKESKP